MESVTNARNQILADIRQTLKRTATSPVAPRPPILAPRIPGPTEPEIEKFLKEIATLGACGAQITPAQLSDALAELVKKESVRRAVLWNTERLRRLGFVEKLRALGVDLIATDADKHIMAQADLGITEADFALPETGTLGLLSLPTQPRSVSLLPRVHLAIIHRSAWRADLHQVFDEAKAHRYLIFITGPSRTSDIELIVTIGVHGPQVLYVWIIDDEA
ncbi:MAG: lactate utilization protein C [Chloroflexi bacterium]|nr:lactate utilization protein C [Chloroflexota bacterium]